MSDTSAQNLKYEKLKPREFVDISRWVMSFLYKINKKFTITFFVTATLMSLFSIVNTYLLTRILDVIVDIVGQSGATIQDTYPFLGMMIALSLTESVIGFFRVYSERGLDFVIRPEMEKFLYLKLKELGIQTLEDPDVTNKIHRANRQLHQIVNYFFRLTETMVSAISLFVRGAIVFSSIPMIIPVIVLFSLPKYLSDRKHRSAVWKFGYENTEKRRMGYVNSHYLQAKEFLQEIFISGGHDFLDKRYTKFVDWLTTENMRLRKNWFLSMHGYGFLTDLSVYLAYLMTFAKVFAAKISVGDVFFQISLINSLSGELGRFFNRMNQTFESSIRVKDSYILFQMDPQTKDGDFELPWMEEGPTIDMHNISFSYPRSDTSVIEGLNLSIESGEKVAIVGHNGAGKTTLVKLISRMYLPQKGDILINGKSLSEVKLDSLYKNMGVLFQEYNQYHSLSVRNNVYIGASKKPFDEKRFVESLERADALDFVNDLPNKFEQILSERYTDGTRLSTGQWQKLAIARFFYRDAPLVIFDEPTAAIDAVSEYNIFNKIYSFFEKKTVIIISHRFSTVRNADRIIVLSKGKIIEEGNHEELMKKDGHYSLAS